MAYGGNFVHLAIVAALFQCGGDTEIFTAFDFYMNTGDTVDVGGD